MDENKTEQPEWFQTNLSTDPSQPISNLPQQLPLDFDKVTIFDEGGQKIASTLAKSAFNSAYSNASSKLWLTFDLIQPYFNIEPKTVLSRLLSTITPKPMKDIYDQPDLYGPLMCFFTLITILVLCLKNSDYQFHHSSETTLLGTSFVTCLVYWILNSSLCYISFWSTNIQLGIVQSISIIGYQMFSICLVLLGNFVYSSFIYSTFLCIIFGPLSIISIIRTLYNESDRKSFVISVIVASIHFLFLIYLFRRFGLTYHENVFKI